MAITKANRDVDILIRFKEFRISIYSVVRAVLCNQGYGWDRERCI
jgi:hypothetical protein